jgi:hypothetical protein
LPAQSVLFASHLTGIVLVIEPGQMKNAMQYQDFYLVFQRVTEMVAILAGNIGTDHHVSRHGFQFWRSYPQAWKRQDVCRLVQSAESPVQGSHVCAASDEHIYHFTHTDNPSHTLYKTRDR